MRCFLAIELPDHIKSALAELINELRPHIPKAKWVKPENMHLTLRFLGEVDQEAVATILDMLEPQYRAVEPFRLEVAGVGAFPKTRKAGTATEFRFTPSATLRARNRASSPRFSRKPSVIWAGLGSVEGAFAQVQSAAEEAARAAGLEPETRRFSPHLTLARIRDRRAVGGVAEALDAHRDFAGGDFEVRAVSLFKSELRPQGPIYTRIRELPFHDAADTDAGSDSDAGDL